MNRFYAGWIRGDESSSGLGPIATSLQAALPARRRDLDRAARTLPGMKRLRTPDGRQRDQGDPDRNIPAPVDQTGGLETGLAPQARDQRAQGKATRGRDETGTRRHLEGAEQGPA